MLAQNRSISARQVVGRARSPRSKGICGALSCCLKRLSLATAELYPADSSVFAALNWRSRSSILLAQASWLHSTGDRGALSCWLKRLDCTQLEIEEVYPAGSSVLTALSWRSRSSILLAQASSLHSTGDRGALSCWLKRQWTALNWRSRSSILLAQTSMDCTRLEIAELNWLVQACAASVARACRGRGGIAS